MRTVVRAILFDEEKQLILLRREKPSQPPYWVAPGGGVEETDKNKADALKRELFEEIGADKVKIVREVFKLGKKEGEKVKSEQHFYLCKLLSYDLNKRQGPEFADTAEGSYELEKVKCTKETISRFNILPPELKFFLVENLESLLAAS